MVFMGIQHRFLGQVCIAKFPPFVPCLDNSIQGSVGFSHATATPHTAQNIIVPEFHEWCQVLIVSKVTDRILFPFRIWWFVMQEDSKQDHS